MDGNVARRTGLAGPGPTGSYGASLWKARSM